MTGNLLVGSIYSVLKIPQVICFLAVSIGTPDTTGNLFVGSYLFGTQDTTYYLFVGSIYLVLEIPQVICLLAVSMWYSRYHS